MVWYCYDKTDQFLYWAGRKECVSCFYAAMMVSFCASIDVWCLDLGIFKLMALDWPSVYVTQCSLLLPSLILFPFTRWRNGVLGRAVIDSLIETPLHCCRPGSHLEVLIQLDLGVAWTPRFFECSPSESNMLLRLPATALGCFSCFLLQLILWWFLGIRKECSESNVNP